jgi:hypothetical protein
MEELTPPLHLRVRPVLDLHPGHAGGVGVGLPLRHDPFEVEPLHRPEQGAALVWHREHPGEPGSRFRDQPLEPALPLGEGLRAEIPAVEPEEVEGGVVEIALPPHQEQEVGVALRVDGQDLAVEDRVAHAEVVADFTGELVEALEQEAALRGEGGMGGRDVEEAAEPVVLRLEEPVRVIEGVPLELGNDGLDTPGRALLVRGLTRAPGQRRSCQWPSPRGGLLGLPVAGTPPQLGA